MRDLEHVQITRHVQDGASRELDLECGIGSNCTPQSARLGVWSGVVLSQSLDQPDPRVYLAFCGVRDRPANLLKLSHGFGLGLEAKLGWTSWG